MEDATGRLTMDSSATNNVNSQQDTHLPFSNRPDQRITKRQILDQLVAPSDILSYQRPVKRLKAEIFHRSHGMDKRHPSSFQQLEKVYP